MIQRIQSLFLLAAIIIQTLFLAFPLAFFNMTDYNLVFKAKGFMDASSNEILLKTSALLILSIGIPLLTLITIFQFKKRILQIRLCVYNILINIGLIGMLFMQISSFMKNNPVEAKTYGLAMAIPLASIILLFLAFRGIRKDEVLVKAYDRLR